ncbi:MAG: helix-turn-helix domain-containing protein [Candidatus Amulumruptor caecigallinarius]|nr:helix-turn-helix domain-containing protein [Candidatus Amulumruptor caecigallinarius]
MTERIKAIIAQMGLSTRAFALNCGLRQNTLSNQLNGMRELSLSTVMAILTTYPELSSDWLMRGEGEMFKVITPDVNAERVMKMVDTITTLQDTINDKDATIASLNGRIKQLEKLTQHQ